MQGALPVNQIEKPVQTPASRVGDGSFKNDLNEAEQDLKSKKSNDLDFPWEQLDLILGLFPVNLGSNKDERDPRFEEKKQDEKKSGKKGILSDNKQRHNTDLDDKKTLVVADVKAIKEALIKFMPNPVNPVGIMPYTLNPTEGKPAISREDLQMLIDKIVEQAKLVKTQKRSELSLLLQENDLGKISLSLSSRDGFVSILISAPEELRKNLQKNISELEIALKSANIDVDKLKIMGVKNEQLFSSGD